MSELQQREINRLRTLGLEYEKKIKIMEQAIDHIERVLNESDEEVKKVKIGIADLRDYYTTRSDILGRGFYQAKGVIEWLRKNLEQ